MIASFAAHLIAAGAARRAGRRGDRELPVVRKLESRELLRRAAVTRTAVRYAELVDAGDFDGVGRLLAGTTFGGTAS